MITRALGIAEEAKADIARHALQKDDRFLLCTDGLTEMVADAEIGRILATSSPQEAVQKLLDAANEQGGVDNITAVVVWVSEAN
jgi:protein phosphatase